MPAHFSSGSEIELVAKLDDSLVGNNPGDFDFYTKSASSTSYSLFDGISIKERFHHGASKSGNAVYAANVYMPDDGSTLQVYEGETVTFTVNGNEVTLEGEIVNLGNNPDEVTVRVDGTLKQVVMGEYLNVPGEPNNYLRLTDTFDDLSNGPTAEFTVTESGYSPSIGNYDLKAVAESDSGEFYHSDELHYDFRSSDGFNVPYVKSLTYDGKQLSSVSINSGIQIGDTLVATVVKQEADPYNVTLVDRGSGQELVSAQVDDNGFIQKFRDILLDVSLGYFIDVSGFQSGDTAEIPLKLTADQNDQVDFLNTVDGTYQVGVKIDEESRTRNTVDYSLQTDQNAAAPTVESIQASQDCSNFSPISSFDGEENLVTCIKVTASDSDTQASSLGVSLNLSNDYDSIQYFEADSYSTYSSRTGYEYVFDVSDADRFFTEFNESGSWTATAEVTDGLNTVSETVQWDVPWGDLMVEMVDPSSDISVLNNESFSMDLRVSCSGGPECVNQNESVNLYWDPVRKTGQASVKNLWSNLMEAFN